MSTSTTSSSSAFTRKRVVRVGAGVASAGVMAGVSLFGAAPAMAYTDTDCTLDNTASIGLGDDTADIQALLDDATLPVICIDGEFVLAAGLTYDRNVTIHGLPGATLDGDDAWRILEDLDTQDNFLTIESLHLTHGLTTTDSGGAILGGYSVTVRDSVLDFNEADFLGGAISAYAVDIYDTLLEENESAFGGAVVAEFRVDSTRSTFQHNDSLVNGGAITSYGFVSSDSSTFFDNETGGAGGAIYLDDEFVRPSIDVVNSTFVANTAPDGGGAIVTSGGTVLQSTFVNNRGDGQGESIAVYVDEESDLGDLELRANLFTGDSETAELYYAFGPTGFTDGGGNLFSTLEATETYLTADASTHFGVSQAALFETGTLGDNGGPTQTVALSATSPAIDAVPAGDPSVTVDQRGVARSALSDAGAFEYVPGTEPALAATGLVPAGWMGGLAALLVAAGAVTVGLTRRSLRLR